MKELRREFVKAWKAWRKARAIRAAMAKLGYGRAGPAKAWYDECTVVMRRARRAVMMELHEIERKPVKWFVCDCAWCGIGFIKVYADGTVKRHNPRAVFRNAGNPFFADWARHYRAMSERQKGLPPGGLK